MAHKDVQHLARMQERTEGVHHLHIRLDFKSRATNTPHNMFCDSIDYDFLHRPFLLRSRSRGIFRLMTVIITRHTRRPENQHTSKYARAHTHTHARKHARTHPPTNPQTRTRTQPAYFPTPTPRRASRRYQRSWTCPSKHVHARAAPGTSVGHRRSRRGHQIVWPGVHALRVPGKQTEKLIDINAPAGPT